VIDKLALPLPVVTETPSDKEEIAIIVDIVTRYVMSDEFQRRCDRFREEVIARRKPTNWMEASMRLGVPLWIIKEGTASIAEDAAATAEAVDRGEYTTPISIAHVLRDRLGVEIVEAA
jgi:hypothetical protein